MSIISTNQNECKLYVINFVSKLHASLYPFRHRIKEGHILLIIIIIITDSFLRSDRINKNQKPDEHVTHHSATLYRSFKIKYLLRENLTLCCSLDSYTGEIGEHWVKMDDTTFDSAFAYVWKITVLFSNVIMCTNTNPKRKKWKIFFLIFLLLIFHFFLEIFAFTFDITLLCFMFIYKHTRISFNTSDEIFFLSSSSSSSSSYYKIFLIHLCGSVFGVLSFLHIFFLFCFCCLLIYKLKCCFKRYNIHEYGTLFGWVWMCLSLCIQTHTYRVHYLWIFYRFFSFIFIF